MKIKTSKLEGAALDWAVAKSVAWPIRIDGLHVIDRQSEYADTYSPSTDWSQGGPLLSELILSGFELAPGYPDCFACANHTDEGLPYSGDWESPDIRERGPTPLIAACRAIVAAKLGDVVEVPDELAN